MRANKPFRDKARPDLPASAPAICAVDLLPGSDAEPMLSKCMQ
jgi:hypothetical protein